VERLLFRVRTPRPWHLQFVEKAKSHTSSQKCGGSRVT
jgi:hypothetical protein